jgi:hypothetical protein
LTPVSWSWNKHAPFPPVPCIGIFFSVLGAAAADPYGEWVLDQPRSSVLTLSFKQSMLLNDKIATSELGFICDQTDKSKNVAAILIPFDGRLKIREVRFPFRFRRAPMNLIPLIFRKNGKTEPNISSRNLKLTSMSLRRS